MSITPSVWLPPTDFLPTGSIPNDPVIVGLSNGNILVVWEEISSTVSPAPGTDIVGVIYDAQGNAVSGVLQLNAGIVTKDTENDPSIAATDDGGFVLAFVHVDGDEDDLFFARFDATGTRTMSRVIENDTNDPAVVFDDPKIVALDDGSFFVSYERDTGTGEDILGRVIGADGTVGAAFRVRLDSNPNDNTSDPIQPDSAVLSDGNIVTVFREKDSGDYDIEFIIQTPTGFIQRNVNVNSNATNDNHVEVAALAGGGFIVVWENGGDIFGRIYDNNGTAAGSQRTLVSNTGQQNEPVVVGLPDGGFFLVWDEDNSPYSIDGQRFDSTGNAVGSQVTIENGGLSDPEVSLTSDGRILVSWDGLDSGIAILDPRSGDFTLDTGGGEATTRLEGGIVRGELVADTIYGQNGFDTIYGRAGHDVLYGAGNHDSLFGGTGRDQLYGENGVDSLYGGNGRDELFGGDNDDYLDGGGSADLLYGGTGRDFLAGLDGNDSLYAGAGFDILYGEGDNDYLNGGGNPDLLYGGDGTDVLIGGTGRDTQYGGNGRDELYGGNDQDFLSGGASKDKLYGGNHDDVLSGGSDTDLLYGGAGLDFLNGNGGNDTMYGGLGNDNYIVDQAGDRAFDVAGGGADTVWASVNFTLSGQLENLYLTGTNAINGTGNAKANKIVGNNAQNRLEGMNGNDILEGYGNKDQLFGGQGKDTLKGMQGQDVLTGGLGADKLFGGADADRFVFLSVNDSKVNAAQRDTIKDFGTGNDKIDLRNIPGVSEFIGGSEFDGNGTGQVRFNTTNDGVFVLIDVDGDGSKDMQIAVDDVNSLSASDFLL